MLHLFYLHCLNFFTTLPNATVCPNNKNTVHIKNTTIYVYQRESYIEVCVFKQCLGQQEMFLYPGESNDVIMHKFKTTMKVINNKCA